MRSFEEQFMDADLGLRSTSRRSPFVVDIAIRETNREGLAPSLGQVYLHRSGAQRGLRTSLIPQ